MKHILSIFIILLVLLILISTLGGSVRYNENFAGAAAKPQTAAADAAAKKNVKAKWSSVDSQWKAFQASNEDVKSLGDAKLVMKPEKFEDMTMDESEDAATTGAPPQLMGAVAATTEGFDVSGFEADDVYYALG